MSHHPQAMDPHARRPPAGWQAAHAHAHAPSGGGGPGHFRQPGPTKKTGSPDHRSPADRHHHHAKPKHPIKSPPIVVPTDRKGFLKDIENFEGNIPYMYRDTKGLVTIGIGFLIEGSDGTITAEAKAWPFVIRASGKSATAKEIEADFDAVKARPFGSKIGAPSFKKYTKLELASTKIDELFQQKVKGFWSQLQAEFGPAFDKYPMAVQYALLDMIFNLGRGRDIKKHGKVVGANGLHGFKHLRDALNKRDWKKAGDASHRSGTKRRNDTIKAWFYSAAAAEQAATTSSASGMCQIKDWFK